MKKILLSILLSFYVISSFSQEHISFNGATFGQTKSYFKSSLKGPNQSGHEVLMDHTYKNMYHRYLEPGGNINSYECQFFIHCSIKTEIVFETITWFKVSNLKAELVPFVKLFEEKYGGHIKEDQNNLGYITWYTFNPDAHRYGYWPADYSRKEMLALNYTIRRKSDNKVIGEIRISAAPDHSPTYDNDSGLIEITYRDLKAADMAISEYNGVMNSIF
jgi:hypothetical protein